MTRLYIIESKGICRTRSPNSLSLLELEFEIQEFGKTENSKLTAICSVFSPLEGMCNIP